VYEDIYNKNLEEDPVYKWIASRCLEILDGDVVDRDDIHWIAQALHVRVRCTLSDEVAKQKPDVLPDAFFGRDEHEIQMHIILCWQGDPAGRLIFVHMLTMTRSRIDLNLGGSIS
jgi:hypothetical protein